MRILTALAMAAAAVLAACGGAGNGANVEEAVAGQGGCGNGVCSGKETCSTCPRDCGPCPPSCGDLACNGTETCSTCPLDCGTCPSFCGDGVCDAATENCSACPVDCGACPPVCGDGTCNGTETCATCAADCGACPPPPTCGDGSVDPGEQCDDGNVTNGDGCSATCNVEPGWTCTGSPSTCTTTTTYTVGGTLTGLGDGKTIELRDDSYDPATAYRRGDYIILNADGPFTFPDALPDGWRYDVYVSLQPSGQTCTVANGFGTIAGADVTDVTVTCATASCGDGVCNDTECYSCPADCEIGICG